MSSRRDVLRMGLAGLTAALAPPLPAAGEEAVPVSGGHVFTFSAPGERTIRLADWARRPILVVNTASLCGFTPQYTDLQALWARVGPRGALVLAVPSNDFGGQEPGGDHDIAEVSARFGVTFPIASKQVVVGPAAHPFYAWAARLRPADVPRWNFHKYLVGADGRLVGAFRSEVRPSDPRLVTAFEAELGAG